jgi:hypothetical protein
MVEEKPVAAFTLSLIGLALQVVGAMFLVSIFAYPRIPTWGWSGMMMPWMMWGWWSVAPFWYAVLTVLSAIVIVLGAVGVLWMNTADPGRVREGATLVLIASIIAFPTMFGFVIGSLLMFIGGLLGLTWRP